MKILKIKIFFSYLWIVLWVKTYWPRRHNNKTWEKVWTLSWRNLGLLTFEKSENIHTNKYICLCQFFTFYVNSLLARKENKGKNIYIYICGRDFLEFFVCQLVVVKHELLSQGWQMFFFSVMLLLLLLPCVNLQRVLMFCPRLFFCVKIVNHEFLCVRQVSTYKWVFTFSIF